ncbi:hypothetical protein GW17_00059792 [Ensete ventricosum]|nr:hypothetical protein GW17_00059792 [Ensete ventricosum]
MVSIPALLLLDATLHHIIIGRPSDLYHGASINLSSSTLAFLQVSQSLQDPRSLEDLLLVASFLCLVMISL